MRVAVVFKEKSDHAREVIDYLADFKRRTARNIEIINPETREGDQFCQTYDIVEYPTLLALANDGSVQNMWRGRPLPLIDEVEYYV